MGEFPASQSEKNEETKIKWIIILFVIAIDI
jgi:hypothetical protein